MMKCGEREEPETTAAVSLIDSANQIQAPSSTSVVSSIHLSHLRHLPQSSHPSALATSVICGVSPFPNPAASVAHLTIAVPANAGIAPWGSIPSEARAAGDNPWMG
jgi:hypothetical protein